MDNEKLKNEVNYRLAKIMVQIMFNNGMITKREMNKVLNNLVHEFRPPFGSLERGIYFREDKKN